MKMQGISTHVFDTSTGLPAANVPLRLERHYDGKWHPAGIAITDKNGRAHPLGDDGEEKPLVKGDYRLTFEIAAYFKTREINSPYPFVQVTFTVGEIRHYQVALLLGPFGYSTHLEIQD